MKAEDMSKEEILDAIADILFEKHGIRLEQSEYHQLSEIIAEHAEVVAAVARAVLEERGVGVKDYKKLPELVRDELRKGGAMAGAAWRKNTFSGY